MAVYNQRRPRRAGAQTRIERGEMRVRWLLRCEGLVVASASATAYFHAGYPWWLLVALLLAPDVAMVAYLRGPRVGATFYNAAHTYVGPLILLTIGFTEDVRTVSELSLIWALHIGADRLLGYGLKYASEFKDTHLQRV